MSMLTYHKDDLESYAQGTVCMSVLKVNYMSDSGTVAS